MLTCTCPSTDGVECLQMRYGLNLDEALLEPCDCDCHKPENQPVVITEEEEDAEAFRKRWREGSYIVESRTYTKEEIDGWRDVICQAPEIHSIIWRRIIDDTGDQS